MRTRTCLSARRRHSLALDWDHLFTLLPGGYDVKGTAAEGEYFDDEAAERGVKFFELFLTHVKGELAGEPFLLEDWQKAINGCIYGWKRADGTRRFREAYVLVPRKNGKSTYAAGFALSGLTIDHEQGAEVYSIAADRMQAALVFDQAKVMALKDEELQKHLIAHKYCIANPTTNSIYKPLSAEASTKHGLNTSLAIIDELHAQPNAELVEVIQTSTGARKQPLIIYITTADYCRESIANDIYEYAKKVRDGLLQDSSFLPVIYEATLQDDWTDREIWAKANPNMGVSIAEDYLDRECRKAKENPSYENTFKRLHLNVQTEQDKRWLQMHLWDECPQEPPTEEELQDHPCWGGVDLSSTVDLTAFALYWPDLNYVKVQMWMPEARMKEKRNHIIYGNWVSQGHVCITAGEAVDYNWIRAAIVEASETYRIQDIGYDPWNASHVAQQLQEDDGLPMVQFRQGFASMNEPSKALERLIVEKKLNHGGNPALRWMVSNVCAKVDPSGNIKPDKQTSSQKIDGVVAMIIAIGRAMFTDDSECVYNERGLLVL